MTFWIIFIVVAIVFLGQLGGLTKMSTATLDNQLLPCPFCGSSMDAEDSDTLHPSGSCWKERPDGLRAYVGRHEEHDGSCYVITCCTIYGGCDASITADSKEEVIQRWNTRSKV